MQEAGQSNVVLPSLMVDANSVWVRSDDSDLISASSFIDEKDQGASEVLLAACVLRQALIVSLRKGGKDSWIHGHDGVAFFALSWTCVACVLGMFNWVPALAPGLSEAHLGIVLAPQLLTWFWCLQNRGEIAKSDFTAHALGLAATLVLILTGGSFGASCAVVVSAFAVLKRSSFPRSRQSFFWLMVLLISAQKVLRVPFAINTWTLTAIEITMMYLVKLRLSVWFTFDKRFDAKVLTESQEFQLSSSTLDQSVDASPSLGLAPRRDGPLLSFDSASETGSLPPPPEFIRTDSIGAQTPPELFRVDSGPGRAPGSGHRRGISTQSSGSGWGWGVAVQDLALKNTRAPSTSDEDDDLLDDMA